MASFKEVYAVIKKINLSLQMAAVFIGTIVGAGLASGQEITQFFTSYGYKSFIGIIICFFIYIIIGFIVVSISDKYNLGSYNQLINKVSPGILGKTIDIIMGLFLVSSSAIILAGSGALLHQYFHLPKWIGILIMALTSLYILLKDTGGLVAINSFIVPSLIIVIVTIFSLYLFFYKDFITISHFKGITTYKRSWFFSSLLYAGFNILCCSGVLVPLTKEINRKKPLIFGVLLGSLGLTFLSIMINSMLLLNVPKIFKYEIPLLFIASPFGRVISLMLLSIIWLEMFSTEVSDIYSISKTLENIFNISYKKSVVLVILIAIPISQIGFVKLISFFYPSFGVVSLIFIVQSIVFYIKNFVFNKK